jgi:hypothetical protein
MRGFLERIAWLLFNKLILDWADRCVPVYNPGKWNDNSDVQDDNNCYNYACDTRTNTYAQPGRAHGISLNLYDPKCPDVTAAAIADGLVSNDCDKGCGRDRCQHQVALAIRPGRDFHWYRKDKSGTWSHKPGQLQATNLDYSGNVITDPRTADRGFYTVFCGCFCVDKSAIRVA